MKLKEEAVLAYQRCRAASSNIENHSMQGLEVRRGRRREGVGKKIFSF